jgi:hypothetical protein
MLNNLDGQKEVIECADFFALSWKLDGIKVSHSIAIAVCYAGVKLERQFRKGEANIHIFVYLISVVFN